MTEADIGLRHERVKNKIKKQIKILKFKHLDLSILLMLSFDISIASNIFNLKQVNKFKLDKFGYIQIIWFECVKKSHVWVFLFVLPREV